MTTSRTISCANIDYAASSRSADSLWQHDLPLAGSGIEWEPSVTLTEGPAGGSQSRAVADETGDYITVVNRLLDLRAEEDAPTDYAQKQAVSVLTSASAFMGVLFPLGWVMSDDGGIRIEWGKGDHQVTLVIPDAPGGASYVYYEFAAQAGTDYGTDAPATGKALGGRLLRMLRADI